MFNRVLVLTLALVLFGCSAPSTSTDADPESLVRMHVEANSVTISHDLAVELTGEHWLLEDLGVDWIAVRVADGLEWTYTKPEGEAGVVTVSSTARTTIPVSHERLEREYTVVVSVPYTLAVNLSNETVEATPDYVGMTIEHDIPVLPDVDAEDVADATDIAKDLLKKMGN